jgi:putative transposase
MILNAMGIYPSMFRNTQQLERRNLLISRGYNLEKIADHVSRVMEVEASEIWKSGKSRRRVAACSLLCYWAVRELGISMTEMCRRLNLSLSGVSQSVIRGERIAGESGFELIEQKL